MSKILTACPQCHSLNNIDISKALVKRPVCGKCSREIPLHGLATEVSGESISIGRIRHLYV
jgi:hypothetical protein